jgi:cytochrome c peroxidase
MRVRTGFLGAIGAALVTLAASVGAGEPWAFNLPRGFPVPKIPADNPLTPAKVELGRHLFYDARLSENRRLSCAACHDQSMAFTDGRGRAIGSTGEIHPRGSMSLVNIAYATALTWGKPSVLNLEEQARGPMFGTEPIELGLKEPGDGLVTRLRAVPKYVALFKAAFPENPAITVDNVTRALASFERTIISARSPYDRYHYDRVDDAISPAAKRGEVLFFSQPLGCFQCHGGFNFSGAVEAEGGAPREPEFHNTGLYNLAGPTSYPSPNTGIHQVTGNPKDIGKFKAPTLRNIALTSPYMHDGSIETLEAVIDHYAAGGRTIASGPLAGNGSANPNKSERVRGFTLTPGERADLIEFLHALTDTELLRDRRFAAPRAVSRGDDPPLGR